MVLYLDKICDEHSLVAICEALNNDTLFEDGKNTAGSSARQVKHNLQACHKQPEVKAAAQLLERALLKHSVFNAAALPKQFAKIMFNRYDEGMEYGMHVDEAFINNTRTDLSFTLFLSDPSSYEGGELVISQTDGDELVKLPKGTMVLYPSTQLHSINKVTSGSRLAAVGWLQSRVSSEEQRRILFDLYQAQIQLPQNQETQQARLSLLQVKNNLLRLWAD